MTGNGDSNDRSSDEAARDERGSRKRVEYSSVEHQQRALSVAGYDFDTSDGRLRYRRAAELVGDMLDIPELCDLLRKLSALNRANKEKADRLISYLDDELKGVDKREKRTTEWGTRRNGFVSGAALLFAAWIGSQVWTYVQWLIHYFSQGGPGTK